MKTIKVAVITPAFPIGVHTFTYMRVGTLAEKGFQLKLFYSEPGDFSLIETKLIKRMLDAGVKYELLPGEHIGLVEFARHLFKGNIWSNMLACCRYVRCALENSNLRNSISKLLRFAPLLFYGPDIIHIETSFLVHGMLEGLAWINVPVVISLRGSDVDRRPLESEKWVNFYKKSNIYPKIYFHCVSEHIKRKAIELGVSEEKCKVIYQGINVDDADSKIIVPEESSEITKIIVVARLDPEKGVDLAIQSLAILHKWNIRLPMEIIGSGSKEDELKELIDQLGLQKFVTLWGFKENSWVRDYLAQNANNAIYLQPSRNEAFGQSIIEAMAAGLPIVATKVGGIPEIIKDQENGLLCEPRNPNSIAEKILLLSNDYQLRYKLKKNAILTAADHFSENSEADCFIEYFNHLRNINVLN